LANNNSLESFYAGLKKRSSGRTPLLDSTLSVLESAAQALKTDMSILPSSLAEEYGKSLTSALDKLVTVLRNMLEKLQKAEGVKDVEASLFLGRIAVYLGRQSSFLSDLVGEAKLDTGRSSLSSAVCLFPPV
jgi:hypothetical protein